ncbi:MAG: hypothetical protein HY600_05840, partial [Candidatus Omnitrophica bacterium]|nr:hypothetical protein [Candidatus Omnitrophota bacterium]
MTTRPRLRYWITSAILSALFVATAASAAPSDRSFFKQRVAPAPAPVATPTEPTEPAKPLTSVD